MSVEPKHHPESIEADGACPMCHQVFGSRQNRRGSICRYCADILDAFAKNDYRRLHYYPKDKEAA